MALSVDKELRVSLLLTGGVGFLGSVCLLQTIQLTQVKRVYVLVRGKKGLTAQQRVQKLLCGPLFHELHKQAAEGAANLFSKVKVVAGDIEQPDLGLSPADQQALLSDVETVIHCAASLTLDAPIQRALKANFLGTEQLLQLASRMPHLRSFVYVSTYYVNNFKPYNTAVPEEVHYPTLQLAGDPRQLTYRDLTDLLLQLPAGTATSEAAGIMGRLNFTSTYAFSKLLTEQLVDDPATLPGVAKSIVRPSLIASMAGGPYPGYISGFAGAPGYSLAYGMGFFHDITSVAFSSDAIIDVIPVDTTSALVVAAAAAAAAHGPYCGGRARVYHAASAASYPQRAPPFFDMLHAFWISNPPPFQLPFARYPVFSGRHCPTPKSVKQGTRATRAKVWVAAKLLQLTGQGRKAHSLVCGFKAFCVQNDPRYARSIVSCVHNARKLQRSLIPAEQEAWRCVWEQETGADWSTYSATALAGLRYIALKLPPSDVKGMAHSFTPQQGLSDPSCMEVWMAAAATALPAHSSSSGDAAIVAGPAAVAVAAGDVTAEVQVGICVGKRASSIDSVGSGSSAAHIMLTSQRSSTSSLSSGAEVHTLELVDVGDDAGRKIFSRGGSGSRSGSGDDDISDGDGSSRHQEQAEAVWAASAAGPKRTKSCHAVLITAPAYC